MDIYGLEQLDGVTGRGKRKVAAAFLALGLMAAAAPAMANSFLDWAPAPTMGWNSWDFYGTTVTETQTMAQADYMATNLLSHGWNLITVDIQWYAPYPAADGNYYNYDASNSSLVMDSYGRLQPATTRFPSAAGGAGFTALADYVHSKGLKFGIHIMRGIPRQAVIDNLPVYGTTNTVHAQDIADTSIRCPWNPDMYGVDMTKPGAQAYYDSIVSMYAQWGVDFIKCDDLSRPYHKAEIEALRKAIDKVYANTGHTIVLSTSPGETPLGAGENIMTQANQWRIADDFWDNWSALYAQFQRLHDWTPYRGPGHFPDADMLPLGKLHASAANPLGDFSTSFTTDEQYTMMSLWAIARSPLILGCDMTQLDSDPFTLSLLTNDEVIAVNQQSTHNRQLFNNGTQIAWVADDISSSNKYLAVFNTGSSSASVPVNLADLGYNGSCTIRSLWDQTDLGSSSGTFSPTINSHGAALYRISGNVVPTPWISDASASDSKVDIAWEAIGTASSYIVKRALSETGPFTTVASGLTGTSYTDTNVTNGVVYYYAVSAMVGGQESPNSNTRKGIPVGPTGIVSWNQNVYGDSPTGASPTAGVDPVTAPYWNDTWFDTGNTGYSMPDLRGSTGGITPVQICWDANNSWHIQGSHPGTDSDGTLNKEILNGYINYGGGAASSIYLFQIPYAVYDIYVYFSSDVAGRTGDVTDGTRTYYFNTMGPVSFASGNADLVQATNTTTVGYNEACDYARFSGLTGSFQTIACNIPNWGGIAAVQLVARQSPVFNSVAVTNGTVQLRWAADTYGTYQVESKTNLLQAAWNPVTGATNLAGSTNNITNVPFGNVQSKFFRIHEE